MTEKRFEYTAYDDGTESIYDKKEKKYYFDMQLSKIEELLNDLSDENEQLKQQLWNTTIDYYTETYSDNSIRRDEHINEFKKEFKAKYGDVE